MPGAQASCCESGQTLSLGPEMASRPRHAPTTAGDRSLPACLHAWRAGRDTSLSPVGLEPPRLAVPAPDLLESRGNGARQTTLERSSRALRATVACRTVTVSRHIGLRDGAGSHSLKKSCRHGEHGYELVSAMYRSGGM